jgi:hypothetical protein
MSAAEYTADNKDGIRTPNELEKALQDSPGPPVATTDEVDEVNKVKAALGKEITGARRSTCTKVLKIAEGKSCRIRLSHPCTHSLLRRRI